ncbi:MAG: quinoprotein dehydrogenase-associated SoxYZ-like carrier [Granulosicoccus sp.]|nr:quinoprotein dehydrogenase-associated SoxYZ-like carrier [Granulosicoccus sp.]
MKISTQIASQGTLRGTLQGTLFVAALLFSAVTFATDDRWDELKSGMFGDKTIMEDGNVIAIEAPSRAHDAATVPITVKALDPVRQLKTVHLVVDQNPAPIAGTFKFTEAAGLWRSLETRIRINEYTNVRAIAELEDGSLHMAQSFVKASGGCSAPAMADMEAAMARAGKMKVLLDKINDVDGEQHASAVIKISHPNNSGMQFDQVSRNYIPAFFVHTIGAEMNGKPLLTVETNFSLSENPVVRLEFSPQDAEGELRVYSVDSKGGESEKITQFAGDYTATGSSGVN